MQKDPKQNKVIATNRKAHHLYHIVDTYEAGIALVGTEVKSLRQGKVSFQDSYATVEKGEVVLHSLHVSPFYHRPSEDLLQGEGGESGIGAGHRKEALRQKKGHKGQGGRARAAPGIEGTPAIDPRLGQLHSGSNIISVN